MILRDFKGSKILNISKDFYFQGTLRVYKGFPQISRDFIGFERFFEVFQRFQGI